MDKILEKKKEVQKRRGGIDEKTIEDWRDIDKSYKQSRSSYKINQLWSWVKKHKVPSTFVTIMVTFILVFGFLFTYVFHGDTNVISGGMEINPSSEDISEAKGSWDITLRNDGLVASNKIILYVKFDDRVRINEDSINSIPIPDENIFYEGKNGIQYTWNRLSSGKSIKLSFDVTTPTSNIIANKVPKYVEILSELPKNESGKILKSKLRDIV